MNSLSGFSSVILDMQSRVIERWGDKYPLSVVYCIKIINYCLCKPMKSDKDLTYRTMLNILNIDDVHDDDFMRAKVYLTRSFLGLLIPRFAFIDQNGQEFDIESEVYKKAEKENCFFHPETGEEVEDFDSRIYTYFIFNIEWLEKLKEKNEWQN